MLWRVGGGVSRRLSIPRDLAIEIPGVGLAKINAAYAAGGPALALKMIKQFTGIKINHLIIVNLANFPKFIDAIGGIDVKTAEGLLGDQRRRGERRLHRCTSRAGHAPPTAIQALVLARTRENLCNPADTDLTREGFQQQILNSIKSKLLTPATFFRLPWAAWAAPQALRTDMGGLHPDDRCSPPPRSAARLRFKPCRTPESYILPNGGDALSVPQGVLRSEVAKLVG